MFLISFAFKQDKPSTSYEDEDFLALALLCRRNHLHTCSGRRGYVTRVPVPPLGVAASVLYLTCAAIRLEGAALFARRGTR